MELDPEEQDILEAYESGQYEPVPNLEEALRQHRRYAEATFRKDQRITIRISSRDLQALRKRALIEGIPYQTLVASVLHKFIDGRLVEKPFHEHTSPENHLEARTKMQLQIAEDVADDYKPG